MIIVYDGDNDHPHTCAEGKAYKFPQQSQALATELAGGMPAKDDDDDDDYDDFNDDDHLIPWSIQDEGVI